MTTVEIPMKTYDALVKAAEATVKTHDKMFGQACYGVKDGLGRQIDLTHLNRANDLAEKALSLVDPQRTAKRLAAYEAEFAARDAGLSASQS